MLARQAAAAVGVGRVGRGKMLLRCRLLGGARHFGAHGGGAGVYRGGRPPTACFKFELIFVTPICRHVPSDLDE